MTEYYWVVTTFEGEQSVRTRFDSEDAAIAFWRDSEHPLCIDEVTRRDWV
jgi:hypothetical protein